MNHARPSLARALPRRHSGLARLRSPSRLRSLPAGLLANARPPLPATAAGQLPRRASRVAALRASARNVRHPAPCVVLRCAVWARPLAKSGAPRGVAAARLARLARAASGYGCRLRLDLAAARSPPAPICPPVARGGVASPPPSCHSCRIASRAPPAWKGSRCSRGVSSKGALRHALALPSLGRNMLRASLARPKHFQHGNALRVVWGHSAARSTARWMCFRRSSIHRVIDIRRTIKCQINQSLQFRRQIRVIVSRLRK